MNERVNDYETIVISTLHRETWKYRFLDQNEQSWIEITRDWSADRMFDCSIDSLNDWLNNQTIDII